MTTQLMSAFYPRGLPAFHTKEPYVKQETSFTDIAIAGIAFGYTIGFGLTTTWHAYKQSRKLTTYVILCWLELLACTVFSIICFLYLCDVIPHSFFFFFFILTCWALQVQFLLQIIVNRICILISSPVDKIRLKLAVAGILTLINISVYCIWIPARLQISQHYIDINTVWDRCEKVIYLVIDASLNVLFIRMVQTRLSDLGLTKYDTLLAYNKRIIIISLSMDVLIIGMMSLSNSFVYMQFHPLAYITKLEIEMSMSTIMIKVASASTGIDVPHVEDSQLASNWNRTTKPIEVNVENHVVEVSVQENYYPEDLKPARRINRRSSTDTDYRVDDSELELGAYPTTLAKYGSSSSSDDISEAKTPNPFGNLRSSLDGAKQRTYDKGEDGDEDEDDGYHKSEISIASRNRVFPRREED